MKKPNTDSTSKRARLQAAFSSRHSSNEKKSSTNPIDSIRVASPTNNDTSGPGGGNKTTGNSEVSQNADSSNVAAAVGLHVNSTTPTASSGKSPLTKEFLTRRVRSRSKTDTQSVPDKSLFSKFFSKKSKKPLGTLITTTTNSIDLNPHPKRSYLTNQSSLTNDEAHSTIDEAEQEDVEEDEYAEYETVEQSILSSGSMSDISAPTKSTSGIKSKVRPSPVKLPQSDQRYYASMTSAPKGFAISYHKCMTKGNNNIRLQQQQQQDPFGRSQKGVSDGANQLKVCLLLFHPFLLA